MICKRCGCEVDEMVRPHNNHCGKCDHSDDKDAEIKRLNDFLKAMTSRASSVADRYSMDQAEIERLCTEVTESRAHAASLSRELAAKEGEIAEVDAALGNASALDDCKDRYAKIRLAMNTAAKLAPAERRAERAEQQLAEAKGEIAVLRGKGNLAWPCKTCGHCHEVCDWEKERAAERLAEQAARVKWPVIKAEDIKLAGWYYRADDDRFIQAVIEPQRHYVSGIARSNDPRHYHLVDTLIVDGSTYPPDWGAQLYGPINPPH